jgi:hypothetical protein
MPRPAGYQLCRRWSHSQAAIGNNKQYGVYYATWCELDAIFESAVSTGRLQTEKINNMASITPRGVSWMPSLKVL